MENYIVDPVISVEVSAPVTSAPVTKEKPSLTIHLNYSKNSHILTGEALKDVYESFRINVLREANWAHWHGKFTRDPNITKGWTIKRNFLEECERELQKAGIPFTKVTSVANIDKAARNPFWHFAHDKWATVVSTLPAGVSRKEIIADIKKLWLLEKKDPNSKYPKKMEHPPVRVKKTKAKGKPKREFSSDSEEDKVSANSDYAQTPVENKKTAEDIAKENNDFAYDSSSPSNVASTQSLAQDSEIKITYVSPLITLAADEVLSSSDEDKSFSDDDRSDDPDYE